MNQQELKNWLHYDPETGVWTWRKQPPSGRSVAGKRAGTITKQGYRLLRVAGQQFYSHRAAVLYMTGQWPVSCVDHINLDRGDDRWLNLREATYAQNRSNVRPPKSNRSGFKGVSWSRTAKKWKAQIVVGGHTVYLGYFDCPVAASLAYQIAADISFGVYARVG